MFIRVVIMVMAFLIAPATVSSQQEGLAGENPSAIKVEITTLIAWPSGRQEPLKPYQSGSAISFQVVMTNTVSGRLLVLVYDPYHQSRPQLIKNGEIVPYRRNISELIKHKEEKQKQKNLAFYQLHFSRVLEPGKPTRVEILDLRDWYEPLAPGLYQLSTRYRFDVDGEWTRESAPMKFEVVP